MFGDGQIKIIKDENDALYINMWEMVSHLVKSADMVEDVGTDNFSLIAESFRIIASTICEVALHELGLEWPADDKSLEDVLSMWQASID